MKLKYCRIKIPEEERNIWAREMQKLILDLLNYRELAYDILSKFSVPDLLENYLFYFRDNNYITGEEYNEILKNYENNPEMGWRNITDLIIQYKDKSVVVDELYCYLEVSIEALKEYIRQKYPEHYREIFNSNPVYSDLSPKDLKNSIDL